MTINPFALGGAVIATALSVLAAAPAVATPTTTRVAYGDLDLGSTTGAAAMDARLRQAARAVCAQAGGRDLAQRLACTDASYRDARDQLRVAQGGSTSVSALR